MADPISAGVVASSLMPTAGAAAATSIPALAGVGGIVGGMSGAAAAPTLTGALTNGLATGTSIFGQGGLMSQAGQGLSVFNQANQAFGGNQQPMQMAPQGQISRGQVQPMDYMSLLNPQNQTVIRPPQISLLG